MSEVDSKLKLLIDATRAYFAALDEWNGPNGGMGEQEGQLNRSERVLRELVGVEQWTGNYR